tara:strand:+ start:137 stop:439 length:303 start_codon:yes stop_codon:yes gene_type:complete
VQQVALAEEIREESEEEHPGLVWGGGKFSVQSDAAYSLELRDGPQGGGVVWAPELVSFVNDDTLPENAPHLLVEDANRSICDENDIYLLETLREGSKSKT